MFTGLVESVGILRTRTAAVAGARLTLGHSFGDLALGDSISVDGVCLTVTRFTNTEFDADASSETLAKTTLGELAMGSKVNLERALLPTTRMGGHLVSGHVDGVGVLRARTKDGESERLAFEMPADLARFVAQKGSITVNGVSLTVNVAEGSSFEVMVIPHTLEKTSLGALRTGSRVNLEVDLIARYVARLLLGDAAAAPLQASIDGADDRLRALLERKGYV